MESQVCNFSESPSSERVLPVCFLYSLNAAPRINSTCEEDAGCSEHEDNDIVLLALRGFVGEDSRLCLGRERVEVIASCSQTLAGKVPTA